MVCGMMQKAPNNLVLEMEAVVEVRTDNESATVYKGKPRCFERWGAQQPHEKETLQF